MAEVLEAILQLRTEGFSAALQQVTQQVQAFASSMAGSFAQTTTPFQTQIQKTNDLAEATRRASQTIRNTKKDEAAAVLAEDRAMHAAIQAQERATSDFLVKTRKEQAAVEQAQLKAAEAMQANFFRNVVGMAKERAATEAQLLKERTAQERQAAAEMLALQKTTEKELARERARQAAMEELSFRAQNARANASANAGLSPLARGPGGILAAQDLFLLQGYTNLLKEASRESTAFENAMGRLGSSLRTVASLAVSGALIAIPFALAAWGKEAVQVATQMESLRATVNAIAGSASAGARSLDFLRDVAQKVGLDFLATAQSFKGLDAAARGTTLEGSKVKVLFEQLAGGMRVMGLTSDQAKHGLIAIEQMMSKGKITAEELRGQLSEAIPGALGIMARALGVSTQELDKMMRTGTLLAEEVLPKFGAQVARELGPGLEAATQSATATFARFGNNVRDVSVSVGNSILAIIKPIIDAVNRAFEASRQARAEAVAAREALVGAAPQDPGSIAGMGGNELQLRIDRMREAIEKRQESLRQLKMLNDKGPWGFLFDPAKIKIQEQSIDNLKAIYDDLLKRRDAFLASLEDTGSPGEGMQVPFAAQTKAIRTEVDALGTSLKGLEAQRKLFPSMFAAEGAIGKAREELRQYDQAIKKITETIASSQELQKNILPEVAEEAQRLNV